MVEKKTRASWGPVAIGICLSVLAWLAGVAAPRVAWAQSNLLANPGFEEGYAVQGGVPQVRVGEGWTSWWVQGNRLQTNQGYLVRPGYAEEDGNEHGFRRVRSGRFSQRVSTSFMTHDGGLLQAVRVPAGAILQFTAWVQTWSTGGDDPEATVEPGYYQVSVGIDPTGGTDPTGSAVVWSDPTYADNQWVELSIAAQAEGDQVTVFARGAPHYRVKHNDAFWDDLSLIQLETMPPASTAEVAAEPAAEQGAEAAAGPESHVVQAGDNLFRIALRYNTTVQALMDLNGLSSPDLVYVGQQLLVRPEASSPPAPATAGGTYVVETGDSLGAIALRFGTTLEVLASLNNLVNPDMIYVGQTLAVPGATVSLPTTPGFHVVQVGETLSTIAARYGLSMWAIAEANGLTNFNLIWVGQRLVIPGG